MYRNIEYCELSFAYSPNFVTNTSDEFIKGNAPVSNIVFIILPISDDVDDDVAISEFLYI